MPRLKVWSQALGQWLYPSGGSGGSQPDVLMDSTHVTSAQLLDLHNTPVELLPAGGGRFYYIVHQLVFHYRFVTTPYNEGGTPIGNSFVVMYGSVNPATGFDPECYLRPLSAGGGPPDSRDLFMQVEDTYVYAMPEVSNLSIYAWFAPTVEDQPLSLGLSSQFTASLTGGDSTLSVRTFYSLIDGAP